MDKTKTNQTNYILQQIYRKRMDSTLLLIFVHEAIKQ